MITLIDTHIHFDDDRFDHDRDTVYASAAAAGVHSLIIPAVTKSRWPKVFELCKNFERVFPSAGLHPVYVDQHNESDLAALDIALKEEKCIAVGECGLDGFIKESHYERQRFFFEQQLVIAGNHKLPTIVHARNAVQDVIQSIKAFGSTTTGVIHSYNGSYEQAKQLIDLGYLLSFGGAITYDRATRLRKLVKQLPIESIMLETDAPDQPGSAHRGERNEPAFLIEVLETVAAIKHIKPQTLAEHNNSNAIRLFNLPSGRLIKPNADD